jgi:L(+)-tartrate dehydratase beta subunit
MEAAERKGLGMPEMLWVSRVKDFGPLIISIDTKGRNLIEENKAVFNQKKKPLLERVNQQVRFIK